MAFGQHEDESPAPGRQWGRKADDVMGRACGHGVRIHECVRIVSATHLRPVCTASDRPWPGRSLPTFGEHLRRSNAASPRLPTYGEYLRRINDEIRVEACRPCLTPMQLEAAPPVPGPTPAPSLPKLEDVSGPVGAERLPGAEPIRAAYSVRNVLSRGSLIDLIG